ncbi:hypothetical protein H9623_09595 [Oerskovia sp. Sa1BUA8]|uniref:Aminoglycoside phosphotransferase domain-containing protein n=1 Tax=Oerskovia douganii TaxID=2762210 RepID=A0A9D5UHA9_9CELL|nr:phosphotransferase [Oerskovia douganii]MBE7700557.1 hypothetical protein [Oerskovia douganii]
MPSAAPTPSPGPTDQRVPGPSAPDAPASEAASASAPDLDLDETLALAGMALGAALAEPEPLGGSTRSLVVRARVVAGLTTDRLDPTRATAHARGSTVVVKRFLDGPSAAGLPFEHEVAGLLTLDRTPVLLAVDEAHRLLVMSDVGDGPTLADLLLGTDRDAAWQGALDWAAALGELAGASGPHVERFSAELAARGVVRGWDLDAYARAGVHRLVEALPTPTGLARDPLDATLAFLHDDLDALARLRAPGSTAVVSPGDTCPDNAVRTPSGWVFLDLEDTSVHHPALDAAYTLMPFSTCWCVFDPPPGLTDALLAAFSAGLGKHLPDAVAEPAWTRDVLVASAGWILAMTGWLLEGAVEDRPRVGPEGRSPSYRQLVLSRWRWGAEHLREATPSIAAVLSDGVAWAEREWGPTPSGGYPAFS